MINTLLTYEEMERHKDHKCIFVLQTEQPIPSMAVKCLDCDRVVFELYDDEKAVTQ